MEVMSDVKQELFSEISTKLDMILALMRVAFRDTIDAAKDRSFARSAIKKSIYEMCNGKNTVDDMAQELKKDPPYIRVYLGTLEEEGLIIRKGNTYEAVV
jgi:DNA-binding MarR family transcriptional regulator